MGVYVYKYACLHAYVLTKGFVRSYFDLLLEGGPLRNARVSKRVEEPILRPGFALVRIRKDRHPVMDGLNTPTLCCASHQRNLQLSPRLLAFPGVSGDCWRPGSTPMRSSNFKCLALERHGGAHCGIAEPHSRRLHAAPRPFDPVAMQTPKSPLYRQ